MGQPATKVVSIAKLIDDDCRKLLSDRASLPSMPDVAVHIRREMENTNWSVGSIASIIRRDPGTTTYLLRISNSALYSGASKITEIEQAIVRIGIQSTRNLVVAHTMRSMFETPSAMLGALMHRAWIRSARLASVSAVLARQVSGKLAERAMLAGLLQDIGVLPVLSVLNRHHQQLTSAAPALAAIERFAGAVGTILLARWGFESDFVEVARSRRNWFRNPAPKADLADLVLVARLHAGRVWGGEGDEPRLDEIAAYSKLPLGGLCNDASLRILRDNEPAIRSVLEALGAE